MKTPKHQHVMVDWEGHPGCKICQVCGGSLRTRTDSERRAALNAALIGAEAILAPGSAPEGESAAKIRRTTLFGGRGFSDRTIDALVTRGVDAPECLLFAAETDLKKIPGVGKVAFQEIMRYRARFIPERPPIKLVKPAEDAL